MVETDSDILSTFPPSVHAQPRTRREKATGVNRWSSFLNILLLGACILLLAVCTVSVRRATDYSHLVAVSWGDGAFPAQYGAYVFYEPRATQLMVRAAVHIDRPDWWSSDEHDTVDLGLVRDETAAVRQWGQITWRPEGVQFGQGPQAVLIPRERLERHR